MKGLVGNGYWGKILQKNLDFDYIYDSNGSGNCELDELFDKCRDVFVATPFDTHYDIVKDALNYGCNVFCEKPFVRNIECVNDLFCLAEDNGLKLHVDWIYTFNPMIERALELKKDFGEIKLLKIDRMNTEGVRKDAGPLWDVISHDLSVLYLFQDSFRNVELTKMSEDSALALYDWDDGHAVFYCCGGLDIKQTVIQMIFENGSIAIDDCGKLMEVREKGKNYTLNFSSHPELRKDTPLKRSIEFFREMPVEEINKRSRDITTKITLEFEAPLW